MQLSFMKKLCVVCILFFGVFCIGQFSYAQPQDDEFSEEPAIAQEEDMLNDEFEDDAAFPDILAFEGVIQEIGPERTLKVTAEDGEVIEFIVDKDAFIFVNEDTEELENLKQGDKVYITFQENEKENIADWVEVTR